MDVLKDKVFQRMTAYRIAKELGQSKQSVYQWKKVPGKHVQTVSKLTGLTPAELRPDLVKLLE